MSHPIHRVIRFEIVGPYTLSVAFTDGTEQRVDFKPVLPGVLFGPLQDLATFNAVMLDTEAGTLVWPNGADFDPRCTIGLRCVRSLPVARKAWIERPPDQKRANTRMEPTRR